MIVKSLKRIGRSETRHNFYHSRSIHQLLITVVFQLLLLSTTVKVDATVWNSFNAKFYGPGDVLKTKNGRLLAAISRDEVVMATLHGKKNIEIFIATHDKSRAKVAIVPAKLKPGWSPAKRIALGKRLAGRLYLYGMISCTENDYMKYIISGKLNKPITNPACPLRRDLTRVSIEEINSECFWLESKGGQHIVNELPEADADLVKETIFLKHY
nr:PREDICTED: uncharacterized protein LOC109039369 [Bemisia tabaci]